MPEIKCMTRASENAGECLGEICKFDLAEFSADEYAAFIRAIIAGYFNGFSDPLQHELNALVASGREAGKYIEWLGKTNVNEFDPAEWDTLIGAVCTEFDRYINEEPPF